VRHTQFSAVRIDAAFIVSQGFAWRYFIQARLRMRPSNFGGTMFTRFDQSIHPAGKPATEAAAKPFNSGEWLLKIRQTVFVGIGVIGFVLLFLGK
jgi:hypothetical protein